MTILPRCISFLLAAGVGIGLWTLAVTAAEPQTALSKAEGDGQSLAASLREQRPSSEFATTGTLSIRHPEGERTNLFLRMRVEVGDPSWKSVYEAGPNSNRITHQLTIVHSNGAAPQYLLAQADASGQLSAPHPLDVAHAADSFAGTDFGMCDLGLEFFHWPQQRVVKTEMRKGRSCKVLESAREHPPVSGYKRVLSWIDYETSGLIRAEAYDASNKMTKVFSLKGFSKVDGRWQLKELEIRNPKTDSVTRLEFDLEIND